MTNIYERKIESCSPSSDLVAYLYGELNAAESMAFEEHLSQCESCTNEFAELSFARLDVYEWHRDEFAEMATPQFVIPYEASVAKVTWLDSLRGFWITNRGWAAAGGAFAVFAIVIGAGMITSTMTGNGEGDIVTTERNISPVLPEPTAAASVTRPVMAKETPVVPNRSETVQPEIVKATVKPPKTVSNKAGKRVKTGDPDLKQTVPTQAAKAPRLNDFEDEEDNTLRLGDLLADVDSE